MPIRMRVPVRMDMGNGRASIIDVGGNQIELPMANATLRLDGIGETSDFGGRAAQDSAFDAMLMIQVRMHGGYRQVVMVVLKTDQPFGQITFMMIVDVAQVGNAVPGLFLRLGNCSSCPRNMSRIASERLR